MTRILHNDSWYSPVKSNSIYEKTYEQKILENSNMLFPSYFCYYFKKEVQSDWGPGIPDLVLIFGAISAAVIPIFSGYLIKSKDEAWAYFSTLLNVFFGFLIIVSLILIIFAPAVISLIAPGFLGEKKEMAILFWVYQT